MFDQKISCGNNENSKASPIRNKGAYTYIYICAFLGMYDLQGERKPEPTLLRRALRRPNECRCSPTRTPWPTLGQREQRSSPRALRRRRRRRRRRRLRQFAGSAQPSCPSLGSGPSLGNGPPVRGSDCPCGTAVSCAKSPPKIQIRMQEKDDERHAQESIHH